jgi:tetratricopeptide (TPR) repeat protein
MKKTQKIGVLIIAYLAIPFCVYSYSPLHTQNKLLTTKQTDSLKEISGYVTSFGVSLKDVNITVKNTNRGTKTDDKGFYSINAKEGEIVKFTYVGMKPLEIIVEDVTNILNIEMTPIVNKLKEVTIKGKRKRKDDIGPMGKPNIITTAFGDIDTERAGYPINYFKGEDLNPGALGIWDAIRYKMPKLRGNNSISLNNSPIWDVDGFVFNSPPYIDIANVKDVAVLRSLTATVKYGYRGAGGVIIVRTISGTFSDIEADLKKDNFTNKEYYKEDAITFKALELSKPYYLKVLDTISNARQAYFEYQKLVPSYKNQVEFYLDMANYFQQVYKDEKHSLILLSQIETQFAKDPEALKALAYTYKENGFHQKALNIYKKIIRLRPNHVQSFRDLANSYVENNQFAQGWKLYMNYLYRGNNLDENGIGKMIYREMESLYTKNKDVANIKETFVVNDSLSLTNDVRLVFEWNTSEAAFDIEFVNQLKQVYVFEHTLASNNELIKDEKIKGYSSKDFVIEAIGKGDWMVNLTYFGNKKYAPTYLKTTTYYNWGKPNQNEEVHLFKLQEKNIKLQLLTINSKQLATVSN